MSITRPVDDVVDAHFFSKEGASHAPDDLKYLISSKGDRSDIPLAKSCGNFNGVDNEILIPASSSLSFGTGGTDSPFSITGWINVAAIGAEHYVVFQSVLSSTRSYALFIDSAGLIGFNCFSNQNANFIKGASTNPILAAKWMFLAGTYDGLKLDTGISVHLFDGNIEIGGETVHTNNSYSGINAALRDTRIL